MRPVAHLQYGWWFAHWRNFTRGERALIALAGAVPDLDGLTFLAGGDAFYRYHHILLHNLGATMGVAFLTGLVFWRRRLVWLMIVFSFTMHMVEDFVTNSWVQHPWLPFSSSGVNLSDYVPAWVAQGVFQALGVGFILGTSVWIYIRHRRTPLEILSPALDRLVVDYAVLPWANRCGYCRRRAHFQCDRCDRRVCASHGVIRRGLKVICRDCGGS